ncbi:hypothetical protein K432DRAFT_383214 [Lepidopterella palustris CBS 459.81]|uniref:CFEM domain-containing protein n=1 Tax=Lepidopterella palustris CBS 459.81 TaxID=1314670 RepID=A0A8E2JE82_9PEZI|nr:hypothetical protein K432DRAFT_383214 [Lepidopterella palustris CBS 459.81]
MRLSSTTIILSGLAARQVAANNWDLYAPSFSCPSNTNNQCSDAQQKGYDWSDLGLGSFSFYDVFDFSGFTCANSFSKRDSLTKRTFNNKCVKASVSKSDSASFSCSKSAGFSVTELQVSVEFSCDLEFHYQMDDGSTCKQVASCEEEGTIVKNTQCGGAKSVQVYLGGKAEKSSCEIGIHSIGFDCSSASSSALVSTATPYASTSSSVSAVTTSTPVVYGTSSSSTPVETPSTSAGYNTPSSAVSTPGSSTATAPESSVLSSTPIVYSSTPGSTTPALYTSSEASLITSTIFSTTLITITSCAPIITNCPAHSTVVVTSIIAISTTVCPVTQAGSSAVVASSTAGPASSSVVYSSTPGYTPASSSALAQSSSAALPVSSSASTPPGGCPSVLPKCMNTWMSKSGCKDNSDYSCYCKIPDFTTNVINCVTAWGVDTTEISSALSYLAGICVQYIPQNPGIITNCPSTVTLGPTAPASSSIAVSSAVVATSYAAGSSVLITSPPAPSSAAGYTVPVTTFTLLTTVYVPCVSSGVTFTGSSTLSTLSTAVTVPQVAFSTGTVTAPGATQTQVVNLAPGTPAPASTAAYATYVGTSSFVVAPKPSNGTSTATLPQFTGAAATVNGHAFAPVAIGAVFALFVL